MMYKRICAIFFTLCLLSAYPILSTASTQPAVTGDILFVYDDIMTQQTQSNAAAIADMLTYLGYKVCYRSANEGSSIVKNFSFILYYHNSGNIDYDFLTALKQSNVKVMAIGGGDMSSLLKALDVNLKCTNLQNTPAEVSYSFGSELQTTLTSASEKLMIISGSSSYSSGNILANGTSSPFCISQGRFCGIAAFDSGNSVLKAMLANEITNWKWPYNDKPHSYAQYVVFDDVYPYFDTDKMMQDINLMKDEGIPYVITVMPIYQNGDYPAMQHFCEVLRYAQANGAAIALHLPIINTENPTEQSLDKAINIAFSAYTNYGVYPVALELPESWINKSLGLTVTKRFRTILLTPDESSWSTDETNNEIYADGHQLIAPALSDGINKSSLTSSYPTAVYLNMMTDIDELRTQVKDCESSQVPLMSLWSSPQSVYTNDSVLSYDGIVLTLNKKPESLDFTPTIYVKNFNYRRGMLDNMAASITSGNQNLLIAVIIVSATFIILILFARLKNKKNFLIDKTIKDKEDIS